MPKLIFSSLLCLLTIAALAQPGTEIYLLDLTEQAGRVTLSNPRNISAKPGYDNQPFFHPTQPRLYYTSMMPDGQTDIWAYDVLKNTRTQITRTPDLEYSPTVVPGGAYLSCIVQRKANGDQDLVRYALADPTKTTLMLASQQTGKIGYQAWLSPTEVAVFVLATPRPGELNSLRYKNLRTGLDTTLATQIGRSLHLVPGRKALSFVQQVGSKWLIRLYDPTRRQVRDLTESDPDCEHYNAWTPNGTLLESRGTDLWAFDTKTKQWREVQLPDSLPHRKVSRMAVKGGLLALVVDE
ncbi:hypothetical protein F5984_16770 [Rudanella paleaurantiibacter]|uniref:S9 family peptidase n=1 Tax=Rudanella paleaurantiibacter TaxID=2614655 RepID=A0A7J5TXX9_9BACT|nr:hypothetical protein [Rudanella paleaurantiibacter]KAB7729283.1 hypothetical protein F5984_16770 [Rudanella paleaurantiibacter]